MSRPVLVDRHVLESTADALVALAGDLPGLLRTADRLGVGEEVAQLRAAPTWASETAVDLRARAGLVERIERGGPGFAAFGVGPDDLRRLAGGAATVEHQLAMLETVEVSRREGDGGRRGWDGSPDFADWVGELEHRARSRVPLAGERGEVVRERLRTEALQQAGRRTLHAPGTPLLWLRADPGEHVVPSQRSGDAVGEGVEAVRRAGLDHVEEGRQP